MSPGQATPEVYAVAGEQVADVVIRDIAAWVQLQLTRRLADEPATALANAHITRARERARLAPRTSA